MTLPEEEIWVKLEGDKGGSCMKVHAQLCNVRAPNSPKNKSVFTVFEVPDTFTNLHIATRTMSSNSNPSCGDKKGLL